ncbi:hypothetical protein A6X20_12030 [Bradyrhizobium elkanii]|nr:hypothetical protein A6452_40005 [Bradyrhizobium elkanii]ODM85649.1 hypothetical protein A6X20_12030 [Bradyrhizobium elkanii]
MLARGLNSESSWRRTEPTHDQLAAQRDGTDAKAPRHEAGPRIAILAPISIARACLAGGTEFPRPAFSNVTSIEAHDLAFEIADANARVYAAIVKAAELLSDPVPDTFLGRARFKVPSRMTASRPIGGPEV